MTVCAALMMLYLIADWPRELGRNRHVLARLQIHAFLDALESYRADCGAYPTTGESLDALRTNPGKAGWRGPYLSQDVPLDPWGRPYVYRHNGVQIDKPVILSYGAERKPAGRYFDADVSSQTLDAILPECPSEARVRYIRIGTFVGICAAFSGFLFLLRFAYKPLKPG